MRFGIRLGPFWVSTSTRRRRRRKEPRRAESYHAVFRDENGKEQRCQHNHRTLEAAEQCAARENRKRQVENHKRTEAASLAQVHENQDRWRQVLEAVGPSCPSCGTRKLPRDAARLR